MKTIDIKGKPYVQVNERIMYFRENYPSWRLTTDIITLQDGVCVIKAYIHDPDDNLISTGHAYEKEGSTFINKTSYIENCETSAVGRALGNLGIGIETSVASAEEVENAIAQQGDEKKLLKVTKKRILDKTYAECTVQGQLDTALHTKLMQQTLSEFGIENWKSYSPDDVSEHAFMHMFQQLLEESK